MYVFGSESDLIECELMSHIIFELSLILFAFFQYHDTPLFVHFFGGSFGVFRFFEELLGLCIEFGDGLREFACLVL